MVEEFLWQPIVPNKGHDSVLWNYVSNKGSLTKQLINSGYPFAVKVNYQGPDQSWPDELSLFELDTPTLLQARHVTLTLDRIPVVVARSLSRHHCPHWNAHHHHGNRSLGLLLFGGEFPIEREPLYYRSIDNGHPLFKLARHKDPYQATHYLARRSRFLLHGAPLSVCEVFLPALEKLLT